MNKQEVYAFLTEKKIRYEVTEHGAVYNMAELGEVSLPYPEAIAKNLLVRDDKKQQYYLITVKGAKMVDLKAFRRNHGTRHLSFASEEDLPTVLGLTKGSVTPLGLLNDPSCSVQFYLDGSFLDAPTIIGVHPNENTATVWLDSKDLVALVEEHGNSVHVVTI